MKKSQVKTGKDYIKRSSERRISQEIDAIKDALKRRGYRIRKQPLQATWAVYVTSDKFYLLTYQPAPIRSWVLHPLSDDIRYHTLTNIIHSTVTKKSPRRHS